MDHVNSELIGYVKDRLFEISGTLKGCGALFKHVRDSTCLEENEFFGIGLLLDKVSDDISSLDDILGCGRDSKLDDTLYRIRNNKPKA
jgi:hypothetical protein